MEGYISQIIGPVVDVRFPETEGQLPAIDEALSIRRENGTELVVELKELLAIPRRLAVSHGDIDGIGVLANKLDIKH